MSALENARALLPENHIGWDCDGSASVCDRRVEALRDLISEVERLTAPPTDDERKAMLESIEAGMEYYAREDIPEDGLTEVEQIADFLIDAGFRRRAPITDEMVDAALNGYLELDGEAETYPATIRWRERNARYMRAALEAAEAAR